MPTRNPNRVSLLAVLGIMALGVIWIIFSRYAAPALIRSAYNGDSWSILNGFISGQASHPLTEYLSNWDTFAWAVVLGFSLLGLFCVLIIRPEIQAAFWGPDPPIQIGRGDRSEIATQSKGDVHPKTIGCRELASDIRPTYTALSLGGILASATLLRLLDLGKKSLWEDEIFSLFIAQQHWPTFCKTLYNGEANMAVYYCLLHIWVQLGESENLVRGLSVIFGVLSLPVLYAIGKRLFDNRVGIVAALLLAISGFHIMYSQIARSYSLFVLLVSLSSLFFIRGIENPCRKNWTLYILTSVLAIYSHFFSALAFASHWASLAFLPPRQVPWRRLVASSLAVGFLALPGGLFVLTKDIGQLGWVPKTGVHTVYELFLDLAGSGDFAPATDYARILLAVVYSIALIIAAVTAGRLWLSLKPAVETWPFVFLFTWLALPIILTLGISVWKPALITRFLILCLPPTVLLASFGITRRPPWLLALSLVLIVGLSGRGLFIYYKWTGYQNWRRAIDFVLSEAEPGDAAAFDPYYVQVYFEYCRTELANSPRLPRGSPKLFVPGTALAQYPRVWLIRRDPNLPNDLRGKSTEAFLFSVYPVRSENRFAGVAVVLFSREVEGAKAAKSWRK